MTVMIHIAPHATELGISAADAAKILATVGGVSIVGRIALGYAADKFGNRQAIIFGFILMSSALFWVVPVTEIWMLYLIAAVFGFAHGGIGSSESPLIATLFGLRSHGLIFGVIGLSFAIGAATGPFIAGYIFDVTGGYQSAFLVTAIISVAGLVFTVLLKPIGGTWNRINNK